MTKFPTIPNKLEILKDFKRQAEKELVGMDLDLRLIERLKLTEKDIAHIETQATKIKNQRKFLFEKYNLLLDEISEASVDAKK